MPILAIMLYLMPEVSRSRTSSAVPLAVGCEHRFEFSAGPPDLASGANRSCGHPLSLPSRLSSLHTSFSSASVVQHNNSHLVSDSHVDVGNDIFVQQLPLNGISMSFDDSYRLDWPHDTVRSQFATRSGFADECARHRQPRNWSHYWSGPLLFTTMI